MKKFYPLFILLTLFLSSCDIRLNTATQFLEDSVEQQEIVVLSTDFNSIAIPMHDSKTLKKVSDNVFLLEEYKKNLSNYKQTHFAEQNRVWMKVMTQEQLTTYNNLEVQYSTLVKSFDESGLWSIKYHSLPNKEKNTSLWLKYKEEDSDSIKYGVFYFNEKLEINNHIIFNEETYNTTKKLIGIVNAGGGASYMVPDFSSVELDIVPEDEDPSKTKAERKVIKKKKEQERQAKLKAEEAKERADMMRINPIQRTFYGATLGTKSVRTIVNQLKNEGYNVEDYGSGQYFCKIYEYIEGASWDNIRIYSGDGRLTMVVLEEDFRLGLNARKRYFHDEVIDFYNSIKRFYREKYSFWSTSYDGSEYEDDKIKLKIDHDDGYRVWATYTLKQ